MEISSLASHWPSDHMTSSRPLIGQSPPTSLPFFAFFLDEVVELLGGGSVINGAYPVAEKALSKGVTK